MDTSENPEIIEMRGLKVLIYTNRKLISSNWNRIILGSFEAYLFHKFTMKIAQTSQKKQNYKLSKLFRHTVGVENSVSAIV